jgi:hypothetical protein
MNCFGYAAEERIRELLVLGRSVILTLIGEYYGERLMYEKQVV